MSWGAKSSDCTWFVKVPNRSVARQVAEVANEGEGDVKKFSRYTYPTMQKIQGSFTLDIEAGEFTDSEILVRLACSQTGDLGAYGCLLTGATDRCCMFCGDVL